MIGRDDVGERAEPVAHQRRDIRFDEQAAVAIAEHGIAGIAQRGIAGPRTRQAFSCSIASVSISPSGVSSSSADVTTTVDGPRAISARAASII